MSYLGSVFRRLRRRSSAPPLQSPVERLESRQLLSAGPTLTGVHIVGTVHHVTGVVLAFDQSLDPASAQDVNTYVFGRTPPKGSSDSGFNLGNLLPFLARPKTPAIKHGKVQWSSAVYDDANHSVTLTAIKPVNGQKFFRLLRVKGTGNDALKNVQGDVLNDGSDTLLHWAKHQGKTVRYVDADGDKVTLSLKGRGRIFVFTQKGASRNPFIFVDNPGTNTVLTGSVQQGNVGNGVATVVELEGANGISTNLLTSTQFQVQSTEA